MVINGDSAVFLLKDTQLQIFSKVCGIIAYLSMWNILKFTGDPIDNSHREHFNHLTFVQWKIIPDLKNVHDHS